MLSMPHLIKCMLREFPQHMTLYGKVHPTQQAVCSHPWQLCSQQRECLCAQ
jgi:hypothetical protein